MKTSAWIGHSLCRRPAPLDQHGGEGGEGEESDRNDQRLELRNSLQHFKADGTLSGDDRRIVVGMDERQAASLAKLARRPAGLFERLA